jgi:DNA-binding transcriptional LysR family regulator
VDLSRLDLNLLLVLDAVLQEKHITRAGQRIHLSQSATSMALSRLRHAFQDPLLVRNGRTMRLTPLAESLVDPVHDVIAMIERITRQEPEFAPEQSHRTFTVVASEYISVVLLGPLMARLVARAPHVRLEVVPGDADYKERMRRDDADLFILPQHRYTSEGPPRFPSMRASADPWVVVLDPAHHDAGEDMTPARFAALPCVSHEPTGVPSFLDTEFGARHLAKNVVMRCTSILLPGFMVKGTPMIAVLPSRLADIAIAAHGLAKVACPVDLPPLREIAYWHPHRDLDPGHAWLRDELAAVAEETGGPLDGTGPAHP